MESKSFNYLLASEIDRAKTSIDNQTAIINMICEKSSKFLLELGEPLEKKEKIDENHIKYNINQETLQNLVRIIENFIHNINYQPEHLSKRIDIFRNFQDNMCGKTEYLASLTRRLQALKDNIRKIQNDLNTLTEMEIVASDCTDDEDSTLPLLSITKTGSP